MAARQTVGHRGMARLLLVALTMVLASAEGATAQTTSNRKPTLRERLVNGLQVRRPSEFAFIDAVIDTVNRGEISERLVNRFFGWSRSKAAKRGRKRRGVIYFQAGLTEQAKKLGISIEADPSPAASG